MIRISLFLILTLLLSACGNQAGSENAAEKATDTTPQEAEMNKYTLTSFTQSTQFPDAGIQSMEYKNGKFTFSVGGKSYQLGVQTPDAAQKMCANSGQGQHIHLIDDTEPYVAKYEPVFEHELADGEHFLLAFLSRSYHESIKTKAASVAQKVTVKNKTFNAREDIKDPMLFYSRPKGTYVGKQETDKVMLDFYLVNATLGDNYSVKAEINGEEHIIREWKPFYIEGLPMGENTIKLTLLDKAGAPVVNDLNPVSRTFTLKADPVETQ